MSSDLYEINYDSYILQTMGQPVMDEIMGWIDTGVLVKVEMTPQPDPFALLRELREALGMFSGAMPIPPEEAWQQALMRVRDLVWIQTMIDRTGG